ncbi:MAG: anthranilate synthase component I family protein [Myxococcales bacterium]|nr:anthranilate synthase component I family protein [Myxococcales bacterium]
MLVAVVVPILPDPLAIARRLAQRPGLSLLLGPPGERSYVAVEPVATSSSFDPEPALPVRPSALDLSRAPRWFGLLPYEACRNLERRSPRELRPPPHLSAPRWQRHSEVIEVGDRVRVIGEDRARVERLARELTGAAPELPATQLAELGPAEPDSVHCDRVRAALQHIARGDVYVVNIARRFRFATQGHVVALLERLGQRARAPFAAAFAWDGLGVVSQSPELFLQTHPDGRVETWPIKGTRPRGSDARADRALAEALAQDPKELAELAMVVDVERNDLGRIARIGSVRVIDAGTVVTHRSVHHRVARLSAWLRPGTTRGELLAAMLPSGSVTGAPKIRAMEVIAELEADRRGLYTGALGALRHDGTLTLSMAIRTLSVVNGEGHYFAGGGIVADSNEAREAEETRWKAAGLLGD